MYIFDNKQLVVYISRTSRMCSRARATVISEWFHFACLLGGAARHEVTEARQQAGPGLRPGPVTLAASD